MTKLPDDKKREILDHLKEAAEGNDLLSMEISHVSEEMSDDTYSKSKIEDIIDELAEADLIVRRNAKLSIVYPQEYADPIEERFDDLFQFLTRPIFVVFYIGILMQGLAMQTEQIASFYSFLANVNGTDGYFLVISVGIVMAYATGKAAVMAIEFVYQRVPVLREFRHLIYPVIGIWIITGGILWLFSIYSGQEITNANIIAIVGLGFVVGVPLGHRYFKAGENEDEDEFTTLDSFQ